jgi:hypothetical protein
MKESEWQTRKKRIDVWLGSPRRRLERSNHDCADDTDREKTIREILGQKKCGRMI